MVTAFQEYFTESNSLYFEEIILLELFGINIGKIFFWNYGVFAFIMLFKHF